MHNRYLHSFRNFEKLETFNLKTKTVDDIIVAKSVSQPEVDVSSINERLGNGDKSAIKELDKLNISYVLQEKATGFSVKYSYNGTNYTIVYSEPKASTPVELPQTPVTPTVPTDEIVAEDTTPTETPSTDDTVGTEGAITEETPKNDEPEFDYTGVNKDAKVEDLCGDKRDPLDAISLIPNVDTPAWDDVFKELEKMKPQLLDYVKEKMESYDLEYNQELAEKYLNVFLTDAAKGTPVFEDFDANTVATAPIAPKEGATIEDLINYVKERIDLEFSRWAPQEPEDGSIIEFSTKEPFNNNKYYSCDQYLLDTADYFLTDEEKEMKFVMKAVDDENSSYNTSSLEQMDKYIDTYAKHMVNVLKITYPKVQASDIQSLVEIAKRGFKNIGEFVKDKDSGMYSIDETLKNFEAYCLESAEKKFAK